MSFGLYIGGFLILIGGLIYGAVLMRLPVHWIVSGGALGCGDLNRRQSHRSEGHGGIGDRAEVLHGLAPGKVPRATLLAL